MEWLVKKCYEVLKNLSRSIEEDGLLLSVIGREFESVREVKNVLLGLTGESCVFLKVNCLMEDGIIGEMGLDKKTIRSWINGKG